MNFFWAFLLATFFSPPTIAANSRCFFSSKEDARYRFEIIDRHAKVGDISFDLERMRKELSSCNWNTRDIGISEEKIKSLIKKGEDAEIQILKAEISAADQKADLSKLSYLEKYAKEHNRWNKELGLFLEKNRSAIQERIALSKLKRDEEWKTNCKPIDQRPHLPKIADQDTIGWCYAFSAAAMLSFHMKKDVSAFDLALGYNQNRYFDGLKFGNAKPGELWSDKEGGFTSTSILAAQQRGVCLEQDLPSSSVMGKDSIGSMVTTLNFPPILELAKKDIEMSCTAFTQYSRNYFPNLDFKQFQEILQRSTENDLIQLLAEASCKERHPVPNYRLRSIYYPNSNFDSNVEIQRSLNKNSVVEISVKLNSWLNIPGSTDAFHSMLVVGQRWNPEKQDCQFLIRNSWGNQCASFNPSRVECQEDGSLWVSSQLVRETLTGTTEIE